MAALAWPFLEGLATRILIALGAGAAAGTAAEVARRRAEEAERSRDTPIAHTDAPTQPRKRCQPCPPDCGSLVERNWNMSDVARDYQARITGFAPFTEWSFEGIDFDGFRSSECLLQEAKARYDQFFDPEDGEPRLFFSLSGGERKIMRQASAQARVTRANPPSRLNWYFMEPIACEYFTRLFLLDGLGIRTLLQP
ncbi:hypothetical protein HTY52_07065 [Cupriavidus taiwanensis]|uniref:restriction endonuclease fold toxin 5 domain-containing protein n=1 Tax=Cupriavidus taiwanensis TaxID=164546 RepID=UPI0015748196|nr:restriction endonuclease fold toxin 5 domain-containing protein [Cupriavidus taiwanensis]NSX13840.1 hypothetical protein [Cupriavidus taiwanensis]